MGIRDMPVLLDRSMGAFYGLAIGDALGAPVEFQSRGSFPWVSKYQAGGPFNLRAGDWTDDTSMAIAICHGIQNGGNRPAILREYRAWMETGKHSVNERCFDIGNTCARAIQSGNSVTAVDAQANGGLMCLAPSVICHVAESIAMAENYAEAVSGITHGSPVCVNAAKIMAAYMARMIRGWS